MPALEPDRIAALLRPYLQDVPRGTILPKTLPPAMTPTVTQALPPNLYAQLGAYLELLLRWNARTNLTAIRQPEQVVQRHFGESLFAGLHLLPRLAPAASLLDLGSGAGFPGLPIHLLAPSLRVTLAESQNKKASFLREVVRTLDLRTEVLAARVETLPAERRFDAVTLRAVDDMQRALTLARERLNPGGWLAVLTSERSTAADGPQTEASERIPFPGSDHSWLLLERY